MSDLVRALGEPVTQEEFGQAVGISQQAVSSLVMRGIFAPGQSLAEWIHLYAAHLRSEAERRDPSGGSLAIERARLSRSQRVAQDLRNARMLGEYAPRALLSEVLRLVSAAVGERMDALPEQLRAACPTLPAPALDQIAKTIASARTEWIRSTAELVDREQDLLELDQAVDAEDAMAPLEDADEDGPNSP